MTDVIPILAIGNSFSQDATYYLHQLAKAGGAKTKVVNLYIGGCSLQQHLESIQKGARDYLYELNGSSTKKYVSIQEVLKEENWKYIITQQVSYDSGLYETYEPYLKEITEFIKVQVPEAEMLLQQTWAYEIDSTHKQFPRYNNSQKEMYEQLCKAYEKAAKQHEMRLIPCGAVIQALRRKEPFRYEEGGKSICRDGFHMDYIYGRYLLAATWYEVLFQISVLGNPYMPVSFWGIGRKPDINLINTIKETVHKVVGGV